MSSKTALRLAVLAWIAACLFCLLTKTAPPEPVELESNLKVLESIEPQAKDDGRLPGDDKPATEYAAIPEEFSYLGEFTVTHYCACELCCGEWADGITYTGTTATEGRTVAVDPGIIPLGSTVLVAGQEYVAEDIGGAIKGNRIDVYTDSHQEALVAGIKTAAVWYAAPTK